MQFCLAEEAFEHLLQHEYCKRLLDKDLSLTRSLFHSKSSGSGREVLAGLRFFAALPAPLTAAAPLLGALKWSGLLAVVISSVSSIGSKPPDDDELEEEKKEGKPQ